MMLSLIRKRRTAPRTPKGRRAYAIGDVHGRLDLLEELLGAIEADMADRERADDYIVFLGDLIDRGPDSKGVIDRLRVLDETRYRPVFLIGNHEEVLLRLLAGERGLMKSWLRFGGAECARSYGMDPKTLDTSGEEQALAELRAAIPVDHVEFLRSFVDTFRFGDYLFVHAGIRPGIDLDAQRQVDLRWIRAPFLNDATDHGFLVIHGHTISEDVEERGNRIGIDTGAYYSGVLTAVGLQDARRWYLSTHATQVEQTASLVD